MSKEFKAMLADRCESWEIAEFLGISAEDFVEMFEEEIEDNFDDLAEWIGLRSETGEDSFDDKE